MRCTAQSDDSKEEFMQTTNKKHMSTGTLVLAAILTALVIVLQFMGQFIRLGPFAISLVLIPIVIGAATCGPKISTWLGFIFGVVVLITDAGAFLAVSVAGTVITVLVKGAACGLAAGVVYTVLFEDVSFAAVPWSKVILPILYLSVGSNFVAQSMQIVAQRYLSASTACLILMLEGVFGSIFSVMFGYEPFTMNLLIGGGLIVCSLVLSEIQFVKKKDSGAIVERNQ